MHVNVCARMNYVCICNAYFTYLEIPGLETEGDGLAWTMTSLKIGFEAKGVKNYFRVQSKANVLCSSSSIPTTITCFSTMAIAIMLVKLFSLAVKSAWTSSVNWGFDEWRQWEYWIEITSQTIYTKTETCVCTFWISL